MRFKVGNKVTFLNERGGGVIKAIIDSKLVKVETDDGFEIPVLSSELIPDFRAMEAEEDVDFDFVPRAKETKEKQDTEKEPEPSNISEINPWGTVKEEKGIYLAFEPHDQQWVLTGDLDVVLLNHTSYELLYNLFLIQNGELKGVDYGSLEKDTRVVLETITREEIENWCSGYIQFMFHSDSPRKVLLPVHTEIRIRPNRFFKENNYRSNTLVQGKALLLSLAPESTLQAVSENEESRKYDYHGQASEARQIKEKPLIGKHRTKFDEAVVDLHIGELVENIAGMSNQDMFAIQMNYFRKMLESAIKNDYRKVTFIHGVGNGVLKNAIVKELEE
ncbi:MAG: DUF2027 domain-containing protein, partial [Chlorobi bacterium]|nr:DUF2027 domain-containing protein [Chlorobiota bacterium]